MTIMKRLSTCLVALLVTAPLAGCGILGGTKEAPTVYSPNPAVAADPAWPTVTWQLSTSLPTAPRMLDSARIAVSPVPGEFEVYKGALWARVPTEMVQDTLLRTLEDSGQIPAVARQGSGISADYRLVMDLRHFEADYATAGAPSAVIEVAAKLLHAPDQAVVGSRSFRHVQAATGSDVSLVADAFSQALGATSRDMAGWVLATGQAHERQHPTRKP